MPNELLSTTPKIRKFHAKMREKKGNFPALNTGKYNEGYMRKSLFFDK